MITQIIVVDDDKDYLMRDNSLDSKKDSEKNNINNNIEGDRNVEYYM